MSVVRKITSFLLKIYPAIGISCTKLTSVAEGILKKEAGFVKDL